MTQYTPLSRRSVLGTIAGGSLAAIAGCVGENGDSDGSPDDRNAAPDGQDTLDRVAVDGTELVIQLTADAGVDQINLVQPNGELFGEREVAAGVERVSFEIGTSYEPGEYQVLALHDGETAVETAIEIQPDIKIRDVGLYRNNPEKPWDEVYGKSETDRKKNGEAFVTVENVGTGPEAVIKLRFTGDVPNLAEDYTGSGLYETDRVVVSSGETNDLYSDTFPFGAKISEDGMGCSPEGNSGEFRITVETQTRNVEIAKTYAVEYSGSEEMHDCTITISET